MHLASRSDSQVIIVDSQVTRRLVASVGSDSLVKIGTPSARISAYERASGKSNIAFVEADARDPATVDAVIARHQPRNVVHLAQQRSAPFSMIDQEHALYTQLNNLTTNMNVVFSMIRHVPDAHLLKMGTMGEYGTPNIEISEGPVTVTKNGRKDKLMFPRTGQSWYHLSKVFDTHNVLLANRVHGLTSTDVMQGVVYGSLTDEVVDDSLATRFDFDSIWGTVINKYVVQAVLLNKLLIYGKGRQTRGYLSLYDSIQCLTLLLDNPPERGEYRLVNQIDETFDTIQLARRVARVAEGFGIDPEFEQVENPRVEKEEHYFKVEHKVLPSLGFTRTKEMEEVLKEIFRTVIANKARATKMRSLLAPSVSWGGRKAIASADFRLPRDLTGWSPWQEVVEYARESAAPTS